MAFEPAPPSPALRSMSSDCQCQEVGSWTAATPGGTLRKFGIEIGLSLVVSPMVLGRQRDLERADIPRDPACHIYIVTQAPRMSILPQDVKIEDGVISVVARRQHEGNFTCLDFQMDYTYNAGSGQIKWTSNYPFEDFSIIDEKSGEVVVSGSVYALLMQLDLDPSWRTHEVLYVGQAFGKEGEKQAFDRLRKHDTLQRIYSEQRPDREIWLSLCAITDVATMSTMHPTDHGSVSEEEDKAHAVRVYQKVIQNEQFNGHEGVALAEAGLIRYFQPTYNKIFRDNFPDPEHVSLSECMDLEVNTLVVELHGMTIRASYESPTIKASHLHFAQYPLFAADGRASLLDFWSEGSRSVGEDTTLL
ncbi:hypothetical protein OG389_11840 [Streptomyces sp. NBC_00435]|uniref:hypothetical protein n=1 Tax=Streptomyces sp. NBC_00435 TaxID=2903649 RepID=UPI002E2043C0